MDHFSPVAPAYIRVLVLPVGRVESSRFSLFVRRLQNEANLVHLDQVDDRGSDDASFLSPKAFPQGSLFYRFSAAAPSKDHEKLSPFELFREPLIVVGVVDRSHDTGEASRNDLEDAIAYLRERHPRVIDRQLISVEDGDGNAATSDSTAIGVTNLTELDHPSLLKAVTELSARFLVEFATYAKAVQASPTIQTPVQTPQDAKRQSALRESERRPGLGHWDTHSANEDGRTSDSFTSARSPPMPVTSFDQMPSANHISGNVQRRDSEASSQSRPRSSSRDRTPNQTTHGDRFVATRFGQSSSQEKSRARGKARVGIVVGSIHMMSGQWVEALRLLAESTTISNALTDHLWHAKGLENMLVCMLLLHWTNVEFRVPKVCDVTLDKASAFKLVRGSVKPHGIARESVESMKETSQGQHISLVIQGLVRRILSLLRCTEGTFELPFLVVAEAGVRIAKLLAALNAANGDLTDEHLQAFVTSDKKAIAGTRLAGSYLDVAKAFSRAAIDEILTEALPPDGDILVTSDRIRLLAGRASVYSLVGLDRKKARTIEEAVVRLTSALMQARKLGAAEMGIHPAASLSTDIGADTLLAIAAGGSGLAGLMTDVSNIYGASTFPSSRNISPIFADLTAFGNPAIKFDILRALSGFCEAAPDPEGVLLMTATLLRGAGPNAAIDPSPEPVMNAFSREEQMHLATVISRTVAVSKHLGLANIRAVYWDSFLVRGVEIMQPTGNAVILDRTKWNGLEVSTDQLGPGNPLLYDPNASRPGTAVRQTSVLVHRESSECVVTLQNPFDIPVDIEELRLVTDGLKLGSNHAHEPTTLGPMRFQRVSLMVHGEDIGATKITGCRIKMQGCIPQVFPIVVKSWTSRQALTTKDLGLDARPTYPVEDVKHGSDGPGIEFDDVSVAVVEQLPMLMIEESPDLDSGCMLLEGELVPLTLQLRNSSLVSASVFDVTDSADVLKLERDDAGDPDGPRDSVVPPWTIVPFRFKLHGRAGVTMTKVSFYYSVDGRASKHMRVATFILRMTVNAALQVQNLQITPSLTGSSSLIEASMDVHNGWPRPVMYSFEVGEDDETAGESLVPGETLAPGEVRRVHQTMPLLQGKSSYQEDVGKIRNGFFSRFRLRWTADERSGLADLQNLTLSKESLEVLRGPLVGLTVSVADHEAVSGVTVAVMEHVRIQARLSDRRSRSSPLLVELRDLTDSNARLGHQYVVSGSLKRILPPLEESGEQTVDYLIYPRIAGNLDLEVRLGQMSDGPESIEWLTATLLSLDVCDE